MRTLTGISAALLGVCLSASRGQAAPAFTLTDTGLPPLANSSVAWGDMNHNGRLDLILTGTDAAFSPQAQVWQNLGNNQYANQVAGLQGLPPVSSGSAVWGDYDNDGYWDMLLTGYAGQGPGGLPTLVAQVWRNLGNGKFAQVDAGLPGTDNDAAAWGDFDNDGDLDILLSGRLGDQSAITRIYRNEGAGVFIHHPVALPAASGSVAWGDHNNDGWLDILLGGAPTNSVLLENNSDGTFTGLTNSLPQPSFIGSVAWGDIDNDGRLDILFTGGYGGAAPFSRVYRNLGGGAFSQVPVPLPGVQSGVSSFGDYDGDGDLDIVLTGGVTQLVRNNNPVSNTPPAAPTAPAAVVQEDGWVTLSWSAGSDPQTTPASGLNHNLRVGNTPGGQEILSPQADLSNGWRRVPRLGNAGPASAWRLHLLPGSYSWSVQAIDGAFAGSAFTTEGSFVVTNHPPTANPQLIVLSEDTVQPILLTGSDPNGQSLAYSMVQPPIRGTLSGNPPALTYQPHTNFFGADAFEFAVHDGVTSSVPALVSLVVTPVGDVAGASLALEWVAGEGTMLELTGEPYEHYGIEVSEDLKTWVPLTNVLLTSLPMGFIDREATNFSRRFYRSAWVLPTAGLESPTLMSPGGFQFNVAGDPGRTFLISVSSNLTDWSPLTEVVLTNALTPFLDPGATNFSRRFYRATFR